MRKVWSAAVTAACLVAVLGWAGTAAAVDPPKWVAAIYIEGQRSVGLRWSPTPGTTGVKVLRSEKAGTGYVEIAAPTAPQYFDAAVEAGSTYYYVLQAVAGAEVSANSLEKSVTIPGSKKKEILAPDWDKIALQSSTEFGKTSFKVGMVWQKIPDAVAYNVYRSEVAGKDYALVGSVSEERYIDAAIVEGKSYFYVISALDSGFQESKYSEERSVVVEKPKEVAKVAKAKAVKYDIAIKKARIAITIPIEGDPPLRTVADFVYHRDEDKAFVLDSQAGKVVVLDDTGKRVAEFGEVGLMPGMFQNLSSITINEDGTLLITDASRAAVMTFTTKGDFKKEFIARKKSKPEDKEPVPLGALRVGDEIFVIDMENSRIQVYSENGELLRHFFERAVQGKTQLGNFSGGLGLARGEGEALLLRDYGGNRIQGFSKDGTPLFSIGEGVKGLIGGFVKVGMPVFYAPTREYIVPDNAMGNIQAFDPDTKIYRYTITGPEGKLMNNERADWNIAGTNNIDYDTAGRIWVSKNIFKQIVVLEWVK